MFRALGADYLACNCVQHRIGPDLPPQGRAQEWTTCRRWQLLFNEQHERLVHSSAAVPHGSRLAGEGQRMSECVYIVVCCSVLVGWGRLGIISVHLRCIRVSLDKQTTIGWPPLLLAYMVALSFKLSQSQYG